MPTALPSPLAQWAGRLPALAKLFKKPAAGSGVGIDIGSSAVKAVLVNRSPAGLRVERFTAVSVPPGADKAKLVSVIREALQKLDPPRDAGVATAVSGPGTVVRAILFPKMTPQELRGSLAFEAEKHIPFKLEGVHLDFAILGEADNNQMEVLLGAARKEVVAEHLDLLSQAGVTPASVDLEMLALANSWEVSRPKENGGVVGLIHVGSRATLLDFLRGARLQFAREIPMGGAAFTQAVSESLKVDAAEAERLKNRPEARQQEVRAALQPAWDDWLNRCRSSFDFFENQYGVRVERLVLSGGSAQIPGFKEWVQEASGLPTELWKAGAGLEAPGGAPLPEMEGVTYSVAVGLAARELSAG
ncbi:MAG: type IV pilus assembly protein PilM [Candidatus Omnitrophica bacterium]|nr:type IV pilus assembly protein PilM [Candidatus Omnitrophota bacterium]